MSSPFHRIGCSPKCKELPSTLSLSLCSSHFHCLWTQFLKGEKKICLPPRGVAKINKLQSTLKNLGKIYSDRLKYCHDRKYHFQMLELQGQESSSGNLIQASHIEGYCQAKSYILIFKYQWFYIKAVLLREILSGPVKRLNWHNKRQQPWIIKTF